MHGARSIPAPKGRLGDRPLGALLASGRARRATVVISLCERERGGDITLVQGRVLRATVSGDLDAHFLGTILFERGILSDADLGHSLEEMSRTGKLHGTVLLERALATPAQIAEALAEQTRRRVLDLFALGGDATYDVREHVTPSHAARDHGRPTVDPWPLVFRGLCLHPQPELVSAAVQRLAGMVRLHDLRVVDELVLDRRERAFCETLARHPAPASELVAESGLPRERAELLVYVLALGRHLERSPVDVLGPAQLGAAGVRARAVLAEGQSPHALLGIPEDASGEAIRAAFFRLARVWHPDRLPAALAEVRPDCDRLFSQMTEAFRVLMERPLPASTDAAPPPPSRGRGALASLPPPTITMTDVDRALSRGDFDKAARLASELVRTGAHGPSARAVVAMCEAAGVSASFADVEHAVRALDKVLAGDPECVRALFYRGVLLKRVGRVDAAVRDFRRIVRLDPQHVDAQRELRLADIRTKGGSGEHKAAVPASHTRRAGDRRHDDPPSKSGGHPPSHPGPGSGLRALLAKVVGRT